MMDSAQPAVLLVEDDVRLAELVRSYLHGAGFDVSVEHRGDAVGARIAMRRPDLIILDLGLPGRDGLTVCREVRAHCDAPILILTARDNDIDHVVGLELGADDYVVKPVEPRVLTARIHALLRRARHATAGAAPPATLVFGELKINAAARLVTVRDEPVQLSGAEFDLLLFLARHAGQVQSRETLYEGLYHREYDGVDRTLDVRISHLRRKLTEQGGRDRVRTVWGRGYVFEK